MKKEIRFYCSYCKNAIYYGEAYTRDKDGKTYHTSCFNLINTYSDDFDGTYNTNEFGESLDE